MTVVLTYTLAGAAAVTGLSVDFIRKDDLEAWIDRLPEA